MSTPRRRAPPPKLSRHLFNCVSLCAEDFQTLSADELLPKFIWHSVFSRPLLIEFCTKFGLTPLQGELCWLRLALEEAESSSVLRDAETDVLKLRSSPEVLESLFVSIWRLSDLRGSELWIWVYRKLLMIACDDHRDLERRLIALALVLRNFESAEVD
jgi:hypothetical protein